MPKRTDITSILIIGSGPIVIGQGCEFDYAGTQACMALKKEGYRIILINSNPATIMTDPEIADATYMESLTEEMISTIIAKEQPNALLSTVGGQTALNMGLKLAKNGILKKFNVELIGAKADSIEIAENRILFKQKMQELGIKIPESQVVVNTNEALKMANDIGYPILVRSSFTLGGMHSGIAVNQENLKAYCNNLWKQDPNQIITLDKALVGWKEYELEVIRDCADNCIVVCGIENMNPLGVHTGDSITVSPIMTLTDKEFQHMRNTAFAVMRAVGLETGGANVQFAVSPKTGEMLVIEMNPRVSRSSALASKVTGFPIAKVAALLAIGYTVEELKSDMLGGGIPAGFEPVIDYVAVKMPRFHFEKFPTAKDELGTKMQSVGEVMGIGRTFKEALQKAIRSLEINYAGLETITKNRNEIVELLKTPNSKQLWAIADAFRFKMSVEAIYQLTYIDPWFLYQIKELIDLERVISTKKLSPKKLYQYKQNGFSDNRIASIVHCNENEIYSLRKQWNINPVYKKIDSCSGEISSSTAYMYSTYEDECESNPSFHRKIVVIGSGPNRIGQGIEFDYCCVQALTSLRKLGHEAIIINSNPETISTDYAFADRLYFSPLIEEEVLEILKKEKPDGVLLQFGGQTPLSFSKLVEKNNISLLGLTNQQIETTENRQQFSMFLNRLGILHPANRYINPKELTNAIDAINELHFPILIRPSYIIGGKNILVINTLSELVKVITDSQDPILIEEYLEEAIEVEVDAICDNHDIFIPCMMENIEPVGIHSGDSMCCIPPVRINSKTQHLLFEYVRTIALHLNLIGLINIQFAVREDKIYVLEVNPRASRTIPFVSKACGINLVNSAINCIMGASIKEQKLKKRQFEFTAIKKPVFPYDRFPNISLGPEMKSIGENMIIKSKKFLIRTLQDIQKSHNQVTTYA